MKKSYYAPIVVKVRTVKPGEGEGPAVRKIDLWFFAPGGLGRLDLQGLSRNGMKSKDEGPTAWSGNRAS